MRRLGVPAAVALLLVAAACTPRRPWNLLLVTFDTTRADHLGCYGYRDGTSPAVDRLAADGVLFTHAYTTNPITLPAHTAIMTGTYPLFNLVRDNSTDIARDGLTTLAEVLQGHGYDTAAVIGAFVLDHRFNLDQGFADYDDRIDENWSADEMAVRQANAFGFAERKANLVTLAALDWLKGHRRGRPFFLWLHYFDPHQPVNPPEPYHSRFAVPYDGEIAFADEQLGKVLDELRRRGDYSRTLIVVTADHGEGLLDHDEPTHSLLIFDSTMHVPLVLRVPGGPRGLRDDHLASVVDIVPSVLDLLGYPVPGEVQGRSLAPLVRGEDVRWGDREVYMESMVGSLEFGWSPLRGLRTATEKLIHGPHPRLYRVAEDPGEVFDRAAEDPAAVQRLTAHLANDLARWAAPPAAAAAAPALDREAEAKLASLGYVTGSGGQADAGPDSLSDVTGKVDPIDRRRTFDLFGIATEDLRTGQTEEGVRKLQEVLALDPDNPTAITYLGKAMLLSLHRPAEARTLFERAIAAAPRQEEAHYFLSRILAASGDLEGARRHGEAILAFRPDSLPALVETGWVCAAQGRPEEARRYLERALAIDPNNVATLVALGSSYARGGEHDEAGRYLKQALALQPDSAPVLYNVGIWYMEGGDRDAAISSLQGAVQAAPADADARFVLGRLLAERGDEDGARAMLTAARTLTRSAERRREIDRLLESLAQ